MKDLVEFLVRPLVQDAEALSVSVVEGSASTLIELRVGEDDKDALMGDGEANFQALQQVLAAAGGRRKPILELVDASDLSSEE